MSPTAFVREEDRLSLPARVDKERIYTALCLLGVAVFTIFDLLEDRIEGATITHVSLEACVVITASTIAARLLWQARENYRKVHTRLQAELSSARADAKKWQSEAHQFVEGLSIAISRQFSEWNLSDSEKDIALLLLKGFSHKEIAQLRSTTEQTVRQQAGSIYSKSGLSGRTELSAFFLEDLLVHSASKDSTFTKPLPE